MATGLIKTQQSSPGQFWGEFRNGMARTILIRF